MDPADEKGFNVYQEAGAKRHPKSWYIANRFAVYAAMGYKGVNPKDFKTLISDIVLRVLDVVEPSKE